MPSKKKAGSASTNDQQPQPVQHASPANQNSVPSPPTATRPLASLPSTTSQKTARMSDTTEEVLDEVREPEDSSNPAAPSINRKKQKRRQKQAARQAAEQHISNGISAGQGSAQNGHLSYPGRGPRKGYFTEEPDFVDQEYADDANEAEDAFYSGDEADMYTQEHLIRNGFPSEGVSKKSKKKKRNKKTSQLLDEVRATSMAAATLLERSAHVTQQALANVDTRTAQQRKKDQIWNDSKNAERENIKQFWLELGEDERKSLVQIEKEAVLRKMKEQKTSCNCSICGRKRLAIEEELEVLYDAYYDELEQYSYSQSRPHAPPMAPPGGYIADANDDDEEEELMDEFDEEEYSDESDFDDSRRVPPEFYTFSNSLRVKEGGILTVADDLLRNDGKEFINMMDRLADRRMQREEEARYPQNSLSHQNHHGHNHPPLEEDDYDDDEEDDDEEYDSQDLEEDEEDMEALTDAQRMEEGRKMFQVFAARMFEQRVMTAYREKVAHERQQKLIEELDEESRLDTQREAKKAKEAAKKKEKKKLQKQAKDEEKAKKEAEKASQEAEARAVGEKKTEEQRQRKEEQRKKRDAEKKAQDEERARKEAERQKKAQEERERQAETERKQREQRDREKRKREEARKKEREEREAREREAKEQRTKEERERKAKEDEARKHKDATVKADREAKDRPRQENEQQQNKRPPVAIPPGLHQQIPNSIQSPHFAVATPIVPKAPTPSRARQSSQQGQLSHGSSPRSQQAATETSHSSTSPSNGALSQTPLSVTSGKSIGQQPVLHHPQPSAPLSPLSRPERQNFPFNFNGMPGMSGQQPPPGMMPNMMPQMPMYQGPPMGGQHRGFGHPGNIPFPPGMNGSRQFSQRQANPALPFQGQGPMAPPASIPQNSMPNEPRRSGPHSRQQSGSYDRSGDVPGQPMPISRPAPIQRPSSTTPDKKDKRRSIDPEVDNLAIQLGSKALLDDSDMPLSLNSQSDSPSTASLAPGSGRVPSFGAFHDPVQKHDAFHLGPSTPQSNNWGFGTSPGGNSTWGPSPPGVKQSINAGWPASVPNGMAANAFGTIGGGMHRPHHASRPATIRMMAAQACRQLSSSPGSSSFHPVHAVLSQVSQLKPAHETAVSMGEMLDIFDTEGNYQNGGGSFVVRGEGPATEVRFDADDGVRGLGVGDIGSPIIGHSQLQPPIHGFGGIGNRF